MPAIIQKKFAIIRVTGSAFTVIMDSTPAAGNTVILAIFGNDNGSMAIAHPTSPSGWTDDSYQHYTGGEASAMLICHRVAQSGDSRVLTFAGTTGFPQDALVAAWEILGQPAITAGTGGATGTGPYSTPSITPPDDGNGSLVLAMLGAQGSSTFSSVSPPPYEIVNSGIGVSPESAAMVDAEGTIPAGAITFSGTGGSVYAYGYATLVRERAVPGYLVSRSASAQAILQPLAQAYFFDGVESDGVLKFVPRGGSSVMTIAEDDLGLAGDKAKLTDDEIGQEQDLPREVDLTYCDPALDYQQNVQKKRRDGSVVKTQQLLQVQLPLAMDADTAAAITVKLLYLAWLNRKQYGWNNWKAIYQLLDPADVVQFVYNGITYQARLLSTSAGAGYVMQVTAVSEDSDQYSSSPSTVGGTTEGFQTSEAKAEVATSFWIFDLPLLKDSDANPGGTGLYFALYGATGWPGGVMEESPDDTDADFSPEGSSAIPSTVGTVVGTLGAPSSFLAWDTANSFTVTIDGDFASSTESAVKAGTLNALLVGKEILQFRDATDNGDGTWTFSHLLRGRRGTDWACGGHGAGETVVYLSGGGMVRVPLSNAIIGVLRYYRGITLGGDISAVGSKTITPAGVDLKPYSPVAVGGSADGDGNITVLWTRRTRFGGGYGTGSEALADGVGGPVNEGEEKFEIDIYGDSPETVLRTITAYTNSAVYTAAQQIADFGSVQSSVSVKIYQISATVGRGYPGSGDALESTDAVAEDTEQLFLVNGS